MQQYSSGAEVQRCRCRGAEMQRWYRQGDAEVQSGGGGAKVMMGAEVQRNRGAGAEFLQRCTKCKHDGSVQQWQVQRCRGAE